MSVAVTQYSCRVCDRMPCESPSFCRACLAADRRRDAGMRRHFHLAEADAHAWRLRHDDRSIDQFYDDVNAAKGGGDDG